MNDPERDINNTKISNDMYVHKTENNHDFDFDNVKTEMTKKRNNPRKIVETSFSKFNNDSIIFFYCPILWW